MAARMPLRVAIPLWGALIVAMLVTFHLTQPRTPSREEEQARKQAEHAAELKREEIRLKGALSERALDHVNSKQ